jgi:hypothetical protein
LNQLKSGDQSIKTASNSQAEALKQFTDDCTSLIGNGATARIPTYGVLAHGICTSTIDMYKIEDNTSHILQDNTPFIPRAEIRYIGWPNGASRTRSISTIIIEFTRLEDTNKIIDEGPVWQGEVF